MYRTIELDERVGPARQRGRYILDTILCAVGVERRMVLGTGRRWLILCWSYLDDARRRAGM